nr:MAG TPA: hypothetical protein [Caudoviricetes sp.]
MFTVPVWKASEVSELQWRCGLETELHRLQIFSQMKRKMKSKDRWIYLICCKTKQLID